MTTALATVEQEHHLTIPTDLSASAIEMAVGMGDFSRFSPADTVRYLHNVCLSLQLNPLTLPIRIMELDGRKVMYATAECSAQLRARDKVSIKTLEEKVDHGCYIVRVKASLPDGREQENVGVLSIMEPENIKKWNNGRSEWVRNPRAGQTLEGQAYANAIMKCHTKAARRATLALCGLGIPDETEVDDLKRADAPGQVVPMPETASDRATALSAAIEAEVVTQEPEQPRQQPVTPAATQETTITPAAAPQSAPQPAAAPTNLPSGELFSSGPTRQTPVQQINPSEKVPAGPGATLPAAEQSPPATSKTPAPVSGSKPAGTGATLPDEQVRRIETIMASKGIELVKDCVAYLNTKGLKPGQDIAYLSPQAANFITTHPDKFHARVQEWIAKGRPAKGAA